MNYLLYRFPRHFLQCFSGRSWWWHGAAILSTAALVLSGFDWFYFISGRNGPLNLFFFPAVVIGFLLPMMLPLALFAIGRIQKDKIFQKTAGTLAQSELLALLISWIYKALTGRIQPDLQNLTVDISRNFQFGFLKHGVFWGWPSSHTIVAFAMASLLIGLHPKSRLFRIGALVYAFYIGIGVSLSIHWFSDFVAGAILGSMVGLVVSESTGSLQNQGAAQTPR